VFLSDVRTRVVAVDGGEIVGACQYLGGAGRCAAVVPPRIIEWDDALASRLVRTTAALALARHKARLIQMLIPPEGADPLAAALRQAGLAPLALLAYLRRDVTPADADLPLPPGVEFQPYSRLRSRRFAQTVARTYEETLDCPGLTGLRDVTDTLRTHKSTGTFRPRTWRLALTEGLPVGVVMVNAYQGRGELVYLGLVPEARRIGLGRALLDAGLRDTAALGLPQMGLAVDVANAPAVRLYERAGFREIRRRMAWFVPAETLEVLAL
jgi:ribosomal protein S18 acetylase RimI-like enzyme